MTALRTAAMVACCATHFAASANECSNWDTNGFFRTATVNDVAECVRSGVDLNARGARDRTPLHVAAMHNPRELVITALVAAGADVRMRDRRDHTPLHGAAMANGSPAVIAALVKAGADPDEPSLPASMDDLIVPAGQRSYSFYGFELWGTPWFFHNLESDRDSPVGEGALRPENPLVAGALVGGENPRVFALLAELATLTDPSVDTTDTEDVPAIARLEGSLGAMDELLGMLKARETQGLRPLHVAARFSASAAVVVALAEAGADVQALTVHEYNALHVAAGHGRSPAVIAALVAVGVDLGARDTSGASPLHVAASSSDTPAVIKALIDAGANLEARDQRGRTPLHRAYDRFYRSSEAIEVLLAAGADAKARDSEGRTPVELESW
ncbi:MAG: ankyrin repeat domain-containing protein [Gammaproteobacteria bacterium]|nr:ankyrin repeat domain-containing protein [Gammaproteobacteria bacterium]